MNKTETARKAVCKALSEWEQSTERLSPECSSGHQWGVRNMSDAEIGRFWCERCGHEEYLDPSAWAIQERISRLTVGR